MPKSIFKQIDTICSDFIWQYLAPRIVLEVLKLVTHLAGLAFPNFYLYYLESQLVHIHDWLNPTSAITCTTTKTVRASLLKQYCLHKPLGTKMIKTSLYLILTVVTCISKASWGTSLWFNPTHPRRAIQLAQCAMVVLSWGSRSMPSCYSVGI